jgi:hypothetical protein
MLVREMPTRDPARPFSCPLLSTLRTTFAHREFFAFDPEPEQRPRCLVAGPWAAHGHGAARTTCRHVLCNAAGVFGETCCDKITAGVESLSPFDAAARR